MQTEFEFDPQASHLVDPLFFSDDENEDNFFTDEEEDFEKRSVIETPVLSLKRRVSLLISIFGFQSFFAYLLAVDYKKQKKCWTVTDDLFYENGYAVDESQTPFSFGNPRLPNMHTSYNLSIVTTKKKDALNGEINSQVSTNYI